MRHGAVDYFRADGTAVPPDDVPLNETGRGQADAAGRLFGATGVQFDRVLVSGLPRTRETAERVLAAAGHAALPQEVDERLQEIHPGRLSDIPPDQVEQAFLGAFAGGPDAQAQRFLGGETVGELLDRVLPAFDEVLAAPGWRSLLLVLHGGVNRALLSRALAGERAFLGRMEQTPACINIIDAGVDDLVVRAVNLAPTQWLHENEQLTTMEKLLVQYLRLQAS
ncbi:histidine phosphatase family protein [Ideonella sp. BN130291]|uniref:histidine phosphatase family protein n=1 Tax=Ideonella sp. BN130291 TaxID=3112940 RepID=UPI002E27154B|nr:histidine phosphatase family protein [Ideonella sp. BN130291]